MFPRWAKESAERGKIYSPCSLSQESCNFIKRKDNPPERPMGAPVQHPAASCIPPSPSALHKLLLFHTGHTQKVFLKPCSLTGYIYKAPATLYLGCISPAANVKSLGRISSGGAQRPHPSQAGPGWGEGLKRWDWGLRGGRDKKIKKTKGKHIKCILLNPLLQGGKHKLKALFLVAYEKPGLTRG